MGSLATSVTLHGRTYEIPKVPSVVVCVDGFDPEYLAIGIRDGILPNLAKFCRDGWHTTQAHVCVPTFTNPNNVSIITGQPTAVHGIAGNYFLDPKTGKEEMIEDDTLLWGSTILEQMSNASVRVAAVTAKDKLRRIISHGLDPSKDIVFSAQLCAKANRAENGIENVEAYVGRPAPSQYSGDLSLFVLDAGIKLLADKKADLFYLTLSDFIQHKHAPGSPESDAFLSSLDDKIGQLVRLGARVAITGDHGMSDKSLPDGTPNVLFLQDKLEEKFGSGCARVICPITDPFVRHHGALGSFVRVFVNDGFADKTDEMIAFTRTFSQVYVAVPGEQGAREYEMPPSREGHIVVIATENAVIGSKKEEHPLDELKGHRLRSHGGLGELNVPLILSTKVDEAKVAQAKGKWWHNWDAFDLVLNYAA